MLAVLPTALATDRLHQGISKKSAREQPRHGNGAAPRTIRLRAERLALPEGQQKSMPSPAEMRGSHMPLSPRGLDFSICPPPGGPGETGAHGPARRPGNLAHPGRRVVLRGQRPSAETKKAKPRQRGSASCRRKGERYQRLALKNASILSKGMMSTRSYRSVCEARGTIISSLLLPLSFLKASSLK